MVYGRSLAWPFRAWATLADERHESALEASGTSKAAAASTAHVQAFCRDRARRMTSDAFWHWQVCARGLLHTAKLLPFQMLCCARTGKDFILMWRD